MQTVKVLVILLACIGIAHSAPVTIHQTNSKGATQYHKPYLSVVNGKVYQTSSTGAIQYHKPVATLSKGKSNVK